MNGGRKLQIFDTKLSAFCFTVTIFLIFVGAIGSVMHLTPSEWHVTAFHHLTSTDRVYNYSCMQI